MVNDERASDALSRLLLQRPGYDDSTLSSVLHLTSPSRTAFTSSGYGNLESVGHEETQHDS